MHWFSGVTMFVIIWWTVIFAVLPFGVRVPERPEPGHATSAPIAPMLRRKLIVTTLIATVIWLACYAVIASDLVSFREMAKGIAQ